MREAREDVRALLTARAAEGEADAEALERVNLASLGGPVAPQLELGDNGQLRLATGRPDPDDLPALLAAVAHSAIELVANHEENPLHVCTAPSCGMFFVGRRRWCCAACGNRARAARHYKRRHATTSPREP